MLRIFEYLADIRFKGLYAFLIGITVFSVCFKGDLSERLPDELQSEENGAVTSYQSADDISETEPKAARALAAASTDRNERHQPHNVNNENNNTAIADVQDDNIMLLSDEIPLGETAVGALENEGLETNAGEDTEETEALNTEEGENLDTEEEAEIAEDNAENSDSDNGETEAGIAAETDQMSDADTDSETDAAAEADSKSETDTAEETDNESETGTAARTDSALKTDTAEGADRALETDTENEANALKETETEDVTEAAESYGINPRYGQREQMQWERDYAAQVVEITNQIRAEYGLAPLKQLDALTAAAVERAWEVTFNMSHTRPDGTRCFSVLDQYGLSSPTAKGENIAMWSYTPQMVVNSWMNDKAHRDAILSAEYEYIGVGCYYIENDYYHYYWTQIFYTP